MPLRYLFGPIDACPDHVPAHPSCRAFALTPNHGKALVVGNSWDDLIHQLPTGWQPDAICLCLGYSVIPNWLWSAPVPIIGLAPDWNLLWHYYQLALPHCDLVLTDQPGVDRLAAAGMKHVIPGDLFGLARSWELPPAADIIRDIDIAFVGNLNPEVHSVRTRLLARIARLADRRRVVIRTQLFGADYRQLLRRSRIVFNHSVRGECNLRTLETLAAGAVLFSEAGNADVDRHLIAGRHYVAYTDGDLEQLLERYLDDEPVRQNIADAGRQAVEELTFDKLWTRTWERVESRWDEVVVRSGRRSVPNSTTLALLAAHQAPFTDVKERETIAGQLAAAVVADPHVPALHQALALNFADNPRAAVASLSRARLAGGGPSVIADLVDHLVAAGRKGEALTEAQRGLADLNRPASSPDTTKTDFVVTNFGRTHVTWETAALDNATDSAAAYAAKTRWARGRLHGILADLTGDVTHYYERVIAQPAPTASAALGCALARAGRATEALPHLRDAVAGQPFDVAATRALFQLLGDLGDVVSQRKLARDVRCYAKAAPQLVSLEPWFTHCPPPGDELASIIIPCFNQLALTRACVASVMRHTRGPFELVLIDNGSTDGSAEYFGTIRPEGGCVRVDVVTNAHNRGFPAACNQGLMRATGEYIVFLNNDTVVTPGWLDGLVRWSLHHWPSVGLVGAVTNAAPAPQCVPVTYGTDLSGLDQFATQRRERFDGKALDVGRVSGFCLLVRRDVLEKVGGFDERYGLGFFDDDDLGLRARDAGFKLVVALDTFVHHHGSRTFHSLGVDPNRLLAENFQLFRTKWGAERTAGYHGPPVDRDMVPTLARTPTEATPASETVVEASPIRTSLCMIVRNEAHNLPDCLDSVAGLFDEIVVVDTGSTDGTHEVAVARGAKVFEFPWIDDFAAARNASIGHATGDYIFWLDADDRLEPADRSRLQELLTKLDGRNEAFVCKCVCTAAGAGQTATVVDHVRLFPNRPEHCWKYRVHEQILPALRSSRCEVRWADVRINHVGYHDPALRLRKLERDLAILHREDADRPDDPFTLFNLGSVYQELDRCDEALPRLRRSLERSHPADSIVRKLYSLITGCNRRLSQTREALAACREGRELYPEDAELLFLEGVLCRELGDAATVEGCWLRLIHHTETAHFASVDASLRGPKARHNLAVLYLEQGRHVEAEAQWRTALTEDINFVSAWLGLGELYLKRQRWHELEGVIASLGGESSGGLEAGLLRGRMSLAKKEFAAAKWSLSQLIESWPHALEPRVILSHVLLQEGKDTNAAEAALRDVLRIAPEHREAKHNLEVLRHRNAGATN